MSYRDFTLHELKRKFGLVLIEDQSLHAAVPPSHPGPLLSEWLGEYVALATSINTEKARSEFIIAPVLAEVRRQASGQISLFSGREFNVDEAQGLKGVCDYLLSLSPERFEIEAPLIIVAEAKNQDTSGGIAQCLAEMVAAQTFNRQNELSLPSVYGVVSTGSNWRFLRLEGTRAWVDADEYHIREADRILGILLHLLRQGQAALAAKTGTGTP